MTKILDQFGRPYKAERTPRKLSQQVEGVYDVAQTTDANAKHWQYADSLDADACNSPGVRQTLRNRTRYELRNNSYAKGMVRSLAEDCIGTGPRLQLHTASRRANQQIEAAFSRWSRRIRLAQKLRLIRKARAQDGEAFGLLTNNRGLRGNVKLDVRVIEGDQVATPGLAYATPDAVDGIRFDPWGNPTQYDVLPRHPGSQFAFLSITPKPWPAESVLHYFSPDRPGQHRGVPELLPALPLFALLRRFTLATVGAAEFAAASAGVIYSNSTALTDDEVEDVEAMDAIEYELRSLLTLPKGWDMRQLKAEHPATTYEMFKRAILEEIARCLCMPFAIAAGNSSGYNYASGRLDYQVYDKSIAVERSDLVSIVLDPLFDAWLHEALLAGEIPDTAGPVAEWTHEWHWDARGHVDPVKAANAQIQRLAHGMTDYGAEYAAEGRDFEEAHERQAQALGLTIEAYRALLVQKLYGAPASPPVEEEEEPETDDRESSSIAAVVTGLRARNVPDATIAQLFAVALAT